MTEFGTLEIVTDLEVKGQEAVSNSETLDPAPSHTPTPPPEAQSQTGSATAPANQNKTGSTQTRGIKACVKHYFYKELHFSVCRIHFFSL